MVQPATNYTTLTYEKWRNEIHRTQHWMWTARFCSVRSQEQQRIQQCKWNSIVDTLVKYAHKLVCRWKGHETRAEGRPSLSEPRPSNFHYWIFSSINQLGWRRLLPSILTCNLHWFGMRYIYYPTVLFGLFAVITGTRSLSSSQSVLIETQSFGKCQ